MLDFIDENDTIIGQGMYQEARKKGVLTRNIVIFIKDSKGKYLISKRAPTKKIWPNLLDTSCAGSVEQGESYDQAAERELLEEHSIKTPLTFLYKCPTSFEINGTLHKFMTSFYLATTNQEPKTNHEISEIKHYSLIDLQKAIKQTPEIFTPGLIDDLKKIGHLLN